MSVHFTDIYLLNPVHQVTVDLVGLGGTGSQVLSNLARMNVAIQGLGHPGFHVRVWDKDIVTVSNLGRQLFSAPDLGLNKAVVLTSRVNRFYGFEWQAMAENYWGHQRSNILITCVDTAAARIAIAENIFKNKRQQDPVSKLIYWMDLGNGLKTGQIVLGTVSTVVQRKSEHKTRSVLPAVTKVFKLSKVKEDDQGPSCSLAEALTKQDLFINSTLAQFGCNILWKLFREGMIRHHGCYVNLDSMIVNPIKV
jgi:PRTRC genetic system ThiF family protein